MYVVSIGHLFLLVMHSIPSNQLFGNVMWDKMNEMYTFHYTKYQKRGRIGMIPIYNPHTIWKQKWSYMRKIHSFALKYIWLSEN